MSNPAPALRGKPSRSAGGACVLVPMFLAGDVLERWFPLQEVHHHLTFPNERRIAQVAWERLAGTA